MDDVEADGIIVKASKFVESLVPKADIKDPFPAWYGWAIREAFLAGFKAAKEEVDCG